MNLESAIFQFLAGVQSFLAEHASTLFGLLGVLIGGLVTYLTSWRLKKREFDLRAWEKILDRRIDAHERLIEVGREMITMVALGGVDSGGEVRRSPRVMLNREFFEEWMTGAIQRLLGAYPWLATSALREAGFTQDYLVTLHMHLQDAPSDNYLKAGELIRQDFLDVGNGIQHVAQEFFGREMFEVSLRDVGVHHKYPRAETEKRLRSTMLLSKFREFVEIAHAEKS